MKELSIEEKAKRYDETLKKAQKWYDINTNEGYRSIFEGIFPELKENEDEKIRKAIINYFKYGVLTPEHPERELIESWIAWLEKQGNKSDIGISDTTKQKLKDNLDNALEKETPESWNKFLDEQGEQKPVDKVEPKFKVEKDKWYVCTSQYCNCIEGRNYKASLDGRIIDDYGTEYDMHSDAYRWFRPWTIQDAKDGDVLCTYECDEPKIVFILKGTPKKHYALSYHCYYNIMYPHFDSDSKKGCLAPNDEDVKPATKEQCDMLFQKMHEAGYEWDAEKKELKKIEQKLMNEKSLYKAGYLDGFEDGVRDAIIKEDEQKVAWSEEDNMIFNSIADSLQREGVLEKKRKMDWLKSLKDRVQLKQEWSEEDERTYKSITYSFANNYPLTVQQQEFVKSLKERYVWKPSDEQMEALNGINVTGGVSYAGQAQELRDLYNDLKKLREE